MGAGINHDICASMVTNGSTALIFRPYVLDPMKMVFVMMINYDDDVCSHGGDMMMMGMMAIMKMMLAMMTVMTMMLTMMIVISVMMILVILMVMMMMSVMMS